MNPYLLSSEATIRFLDCDPYGQLYNARYIDYFMNAREDQLVANYDFDVYAHTRDTGCGWVVASNQIAYFEPAVMREHVRITSKTIALDSTSLVAEFQMLRSDSDLVKAFMWTRFVYFDITRRQRAEHPEELLQQYRERVIPVDAPDFTSRTRQLRQASLTK